MQKLFIETNIVIDLLAQREPFYSESALLFSRADKKKIKLGVSSLTIANIHYILQQQMSASKAKMVLRKLKLIVDIYPLDNKIISLALNDDMFTDFEDALQYFTAIEHKQDAIITRNVKDYKKSQLPIHTAKEYLSYAK